MMADPASVNAVKEIMNGPAGIVVGVYLTLHVIDKFAFWVVKWKGRNGKAHARCIDSEMAKDAVDRGKVMNATIKRNEDHLKSMSRSSIEMVTVLRGIEKNGKM